MDHTPLLYRQFAEDLAPGQAGPDHGGVAGGAEGRPHQLQGAEARERDFSSLFWLLMRTGSVENPSSGIKWYPECAPEYTRVMELYSLLDDN